MARRKNTLPAGLIIVVLIVGGAAQGLKALGDLPSGLWMAIAGVLLGIGGILIATLAVQKLRDAQAGRAAARKAAAVIKQHLPSLVRRQAQLVRPDAYGKPRFEQWAKEINYFVDEHIKPQLTSREHLVFMRERQSEIMAAIHLAVDKEAERNPAFAEFSDEMTPTEFEAFCADELRRAGWKSQVTLRSRDQGVDVIAEKDGVRVVLQCKLYSRPVGNKAVQEATAARAHERANFGVVVSNHRYTKDAEQLAATNSVLLLHYSDLRNLDSLIERRTIVADDWYYEDGRGQAGPLTLADLKKTMAALSNPADVWVWCDRFSDWKKASDVPELSRRRMTSRDDSKRA